MKKFEFTGETITNNFGVELHRIRAVVNIESVGVHIGDLGGFIEKEENLSHSGNAWVYDNAWVSGYALVSDNAKVSDYAKVSGDAKLYGNAWVHSYAEVSGYALVYGDAEVSGYAKVYGDAEVYGDAWVYGDAEVSGYAEVSGNARVYGDAEVKKVTHILTIGPIGSRNDTITFFRAKDNTINIKCGCFRGTVDEFIEKVKFTHGDNKHAKVYLMAAELAKTQIELD